MKFGAPIDKKGRQRAAAFTLAEVLAAMMFMAIVIPVAVEAVRIASLSGEVAQRKGEAVLVADRVLNESILMTNWTQGTLNGTTTEGTHDFRWTLRDEFWSQDPQSQMQLLTAEVTFSAQGRDYSVRLSTLENSPNTTMLPNIF